MAAAGDGRGRQIPTHPAIHVSEPIGCLVASKTKLLGEICTAASVMRHGSNQLQRFRRTVFWYVVYGVTGFACGAYSSNSILHRLDITARL
ncbi:hypothetical protein D3C76_1628580 [compost metagenome]